MQNGKPTVIEFYATWCKDCKAMAPQMTDFEKKFSKQINFVVLDAEKVCVSRSIDPRMPFSNVPLSSILSAFFRLVVPDVP